MNESGAQRDVRFGRPGRASSKARTLARLCSAGLFGALLCVRLQAIAQPPSDDRTAPASGRSDQTGPANSDFLGDLSSRLAPDRGNKDWLVYIPDPSALSRANAFLVEPVKVMLGPQVQKQDVPQEDLDKLAETLRNDMRDELAKGHYKVVDEPGPGVSALRLAITDVEPNGGKTNPEPGGADAAPRFKAGQMSIEGELVDSQSSQVEMAFMTAKGGRRFFIGLKPFQRWNDIDAAFKGWSKNLRDRLDKAHKQIVF